MRYAAAAGSLCVKLFTTAGLLMSAWTYVCLSGACACAYVCMCGYVLCSREAYTYLAKQGAPLHLATYVYPLGAVPVAMFPEGQQYVPAAQCMQLHVPYSLKCARLQNTWQQHHRQGVCEAHVATRSASCSRVRPGL